MSKREKIILVLTGIAVAYGLYALLFAPATKTSLVNTESQVADTKKLVSDVTEGLNKGKLLEVEGYIMERAEAPWPRDPFLLTDTAETKTVVEDVEDGVNFIYSGFVELGSIRLAIINGREYQVGEALEEKGYKVRKILPERVVIEQEQIKKEIVVPHQEVAITGPSPVEGKR